MSNYAHRKLAAAVVERAVKDLEARREDVRRRARAWWLMPDNPLRVFWTDAAGVGEVAMVEALERRGMLG